MAAGCASAAAATGADPINWKGVTDWSPLFISPQILAVDDRHRPIGRLEIVEQSRVDRDPPRLDHKTLGARLLKHYTTFLMPSSKLTSIAVVLLDSGSIIGPFRIQFML